MARAPSSWRQRGDLESRGSASRSGRAGSGETSRSFLAAGHQLFPLEGLRAQPVGGRPRRSAHATRPGPARGRSDWPPSAAGFVSGSGPARPRGRRARRFVAAARASRRALSASGARSSPPQSRRPRRFRFPSRHPSGIFLGILLWRRRSPRAATSRLSRADLARHLAHFSCRTLITAQPTISYSPAVGDMRQLQLRERAVHARPSPGVPAREQHGAPS